MKRISFIKTLEVEPDALVKYLPIEADFPVEIEVEFTYLVHAWDETRNEPRELHLEFTDATFVKTRRPVDCSIITEKQWGDIDDSAYEKYCEYKED